MDKKEMTEEQERAARKLADIYGVSPSAMMLVTAPERELAEELEVRRLAAAYGIREDLLRQIRRENRGDDNG